MGTNYKLSNLLSALGLAQMKRLRKIIKKRLEMAKIYDEQISKINFIEVQRPSLNSYYTRQSYVCYFTKPNLRNKVIKNLARQNIEAQIGTYALHCLPAFRNCKKIGRLKNSEFLYKNSITLPLHEELSLRDQEFVCKIIKETK